MKSIGVILLLSIGTISTISNINLINNIQCHLIKIMPKLLYFKNLNYEIKKKSAAQFNHYKKSHLSTTTKANLLDVYMQVVSKPLNIFA